MAVCEQLCPCGSESGVGAYERSGEAVGKPAAAASTRLAEGHQGILDDADASDDSLSGCVCGGGDWRLPAGGAGQDT